jgi:hypothetical protein
VRNPLHNKYSELMNLMVDITQTQIRLRPDCSKILANKDKWSLSADDVKDDPNIRRYLETEPNKESLKENFVHTFIYRKLYGKV